MARFDRTWIPMFVSLQYNESYTVDNNAIDVR